MTQVPCHGLQPLFGAGDLPPVCGRIAAGFPLEAVEDRQRDELQSLLSNAGRYALRVGDNAMVDAGIQQDDIVIVQSLQRVRNGDIVVVLIDNEQLTLKRIRHLADGRVCLYCLEPDADGREFAGERIAVQGKLIGQLRQYP